MHPVIQNNHRLLFYAAWFLLNVLQAAFTELQDDEAYYWVYAHYLDWGYFDHPPMTALMIWAGSIIPGELGVRIIAAIMNTATLFLCEGLTVRKDPFLFYAICFSLAVVQITGFMTVPDTPLMFFTALFFRQYKQFLDDPSWWNALGLGLVTACLMYSKYHGVLIVFFVLLSNLKLFRDPKVYAAGFLALALFLPHLYWQYSHDWITFKYHLFESNVNRYKVNYTIEYILGQILLAGPLAGIILLPATLLWKPVNSLERALKFTAVGIFLFFFLSSFKGKVEANWTSPAIIPIIVLSHHFLQEKIKWRLLLYRLLPVTLVLVVAARVVMIFDIIPVRQVVQRYHAWKTWPAEMARKTENLPIVFNNSYQRASKYWYYTGQKTFSLNDHKERRNNYNFWPVEDSLIGKPVYILDIYNLYALTDSLKAPLWQVGYRREETWSSFAKVFIHPSRNIFKVPRQRGYFNTACTVTFPEHYRRFLESHPGEEKEVILGVFQNNKWVKDIPTGISLKQLSAGGNFEFNFPVPLPQGTYTIRFAIGSDSGLHSHNSEKMTLYVV